MSLVLDCNGGILIGTTFNLWKKSSRNLPSLINSFKFFEVEEIILMFTYISFVPLILLNFWSIKTRNIWAWVSIGISETSSINKVPLLAFSRIPKEIVPSEYSSPNNSFSYFSSANKEPLNTMNGLLVLGEFLWIFLATSSFPLPVGPDINTLLSADDNLSIIFLILTISPLSPIKSKEWNSFFSRLSLSYFKLEVSRALLT